MLAFLATFFDFAALVLQIFTLLGNTYNRPFLRDLYFARLNIGNEFIDFGLWNYCTGSGNTVDECSKPQAAFDWTNAAGSAADSISGLDGLQKVFLANFILYWIGFGLTLFALLSTMMTHFNRGTDLCASFVTFIAALVMIVVFVILLVISLRGVNAARDSGADASGHLGPSMWMTLGAMVALLISSFWYCLTCCFGPGRRVRNEDKV